MPRACSIRAVVSPPTPPPTMMAFIHAHATLVSEPRPPDSVAISYQRCSTASCCVLHRIRDEIIAQGGTRDQPRGTHTVSGVYGGVTRWINAATIGQGTSHDAAVNSVRQGLGAARDPQGRERPFADVGRPALHP